jgi:hypothetical protein
VFYRAELRPILQARDIAVMSFGVSQLVDVLSPKPPKDKPTDTAPPVTPPVVTPPVVTPPVTPPGQDKDKTK